MMNLGYIHQENLPTQLFGRPHGFITRVTVLLILPRSKKHPPPQPHMAGVLAQLTKLNICSWLFVDKAAAAGPSLTCQGRTYTP